MADKLLRVSVSWLGHPDRTVASVNEARALIETFCRRGRKSVIGNFDKRGDADGFAFDYARVGSLRWERANWWREGDSPGKYEGCIVCVYEKEALR